MDKITFDFKLNSNERKLFIMDLVNEIPDNPNYENALQISYKFEQVINKFDLNHLFSNSMESIYTIPEVFQQFSQTFMDGISVKLNNPGDSLFTLSNTKYFAFANIITRDLSRRWGKIWEDIAVISPKVVSPEKTFGGYKIPGVDFLMLLHNKLYFCQMKTAKNTLTGSQAPRSRTELELFQNSAFISAFDIGSWHFNSSHTQRLAGEQFWKLIDINYFEIETNFIKTLENIENEFRDRFV